jgi:hypothetical protein
MPSLPVFTRLDRSGTAFVNGDRVKLTDRKNLSISAIVLGNGNKIIFAGRFDDCLYTTRHLSKLGQSLIPACLDEQESFVKFFIGHCASASLAFWDKHRADRIAARTPLS